MKKAIIGVAVAAAFALPFTVQAQGSDGGSGPARDAGTMHTPASSTPGTTSVPNVGAGSTTAPGAGSLSFSEIDRNNDGMISRAEWDAYHARGSSAGSTAGSTTRQSGQGSNLGGGAATPPGAGRGVGDNTQTPGRPNSATGGQPQ